ncbi:hypothetical protein, partial [Adlercreutzia equolifaciens]
MDSIMHIYHFPQPTLFPIFSGRLPKRREDLEVRSAHLHALTWEQRRLGEVAHRVTRKNEEGMSDLPLTISAQH